MSTSSLIYGLYMAYTYSCVAIFVGNTVHRIFVENFDTSLV